MENEHKRRLLARLEAIRVAVEENDLSDDVLKAAYSELHRLDSVFPKGIKTHSLRELKGLGKEYWRSIDVDKYLREERASWR